MKPKTPLHWRKIFRLYHDAFGRDTERAAFLEKACAGNAALRQEVDFLIALSGEPGDGSGLPISEILRQLLADRLAASSGVEPVDGGR